MNDPMRSHLVERSRFSSLFFLAKNVLCVQHNRCISDGFWLYLHTLLMRLLPRVLISSWFCFVTTVFHRRLYCYRNVFTFICEIEKVCCCRIVVPLRKQWGLSSIPRVWSFARATLFFRSALKLFMATRMHKKLKTSTAWVPQCFERLWYSWRLPIITVFCGCRGKHTHKTSGVTIGSANGPPIRATNFCVELLRPEQVCLGLRGHFHFAVKVGQPGGTVRWFNVPM